MVPLSYQSPNLSLIALKTMRLLVLTSKTKDNVKKKETKPVNKKYTGSVF